MCYSVESSLKTTTISFVAILYLMTSNIPHFQWIGIALIGWCGMQFDELLLWLTHPRKGCTKLNEIITMTLIPFTLACQPLFAMWGSLYVFPWKTLSKFKKQCMIAYTVFCSLVVSYAYYYKPDKTCTTVTEKGHLSWVTSNYVRKSTTLTPLWFIMIALPVLLIWNKKYMLLLLLSIIPFFGYYHGKDTGAHGSIWCYYTSYTSIIASVALFLHQFNIYRIL